MPTATLLEQLRALQCELVDLAFALNRRGRQDAADLARSISKRLTELIDRNERSGSQLHLPRG